MKRLLIAILTIMLLAGPAFAGNKSGFMTADQKAALDGANAPSASNVLATMDDVDAADTGLQDFQDGIKADSIVESTADAGVTIEGTQLKDNDVYTGYIVVDNNSGAINIATMTMTDLDDTDVEQSFTFDIGGKIFKLYTEAKGVENGAKNPSIQVDSDKVVVSEGTNLQAIMHGSVTVSTTNYDGTATITYGKTFTATPTVVVTVAETLNAGYDSIVNVEDIGMDTCIVRLIDCVDNDSSISVGYIVMGSE